MIGSVPLKHPKYEAFAQHKAAGETDAKAYELAGFSPSAVRNVPRMLKTHAEIGERISYLVGQRTTIIQQSNQEVMEKVGIDKQWVLERLVRVHERAMQGEPARRIDGTPITNQQGEPIYRDPNLPAATKALELIGKEIGMFVTTVKTDESDPLLALLRRVSGGSLPVVHDVTDADDEDDE